MKEIKLTEEDNGLVIKQVDNGFIIESLSIFGEEDNEYIKTIELFEESEEEDAIEDMIKVLQTIKDFFGLHYNKHNKWNLVIKKEENKE